MDWPEFLEVAYPATLRVAEVRRGRAWKANRWIGLRAGYVLFRAGFSAGTVSLARVILVLIGLAVLSENTRGFAAWLGLGLLALQVNLDFADGPVARARHESSEFGTEIDELANALGRQGVLILLGYWTGSVAGLVSSIFAAYLFVAFRLQVGRSYPEIVSRPKTQWRMIRWLSMVTVGVLLVPSVVLSASLVGISVPAVSWALLALYVMSGTWWLVAISAHVASASPKTGAPPPAGYAPAMRGVWRRIR